MQTVKQGTDCSQIGNEEVEVWQEENQMVLQWAEDEKLEDLGFKKKGRNEQVTGAKKKKVKGLSTEEMKDPANSHLEEDTYELRTWRGRDQEEVDECWNESAVNIDEDALDEYKVEDSQREAYRCRGSSLEWRRARRSRKYRIRKWRECCCARIFALFRVEFAASDKHA